LIYAWFKERKYLTLSFYLFLVEVGLLLPIYFIVKLSLEGDSEISSPLLSQIHRLIVNPLLMFLLMVGFIYQRVRIKNA
jgi:exosortase F-associated protein